MEKVKIMYYVFKLKLMHVWCAQLYVMCTPVALLYLLLLGWPLFVCVYISCTRSENLAVGGGGEFTLHNMLTGILIGGGVSIRCDIENQLFPKR